MPTKLNKDQIDGLPSDLESLESFISVEDSLGDSADVSQDIVIDSIELIINESVQSQIDMLKSTLGEYIYPDTYIYQMGNTFYFAGGTMSYPINTTVTFKWYYATIPSEENWIEISDYFESRLAPTDDFANPEWKYYLEVTYTSDLGIFKKRSNEISYVTPE